MAAETEGEGAAGAETSSNPQDDAKSDESKIDMENLDMFERTDLNTRLTGRKSKGEEALWYIIYPDDKFRGRWDFFITM